MYRKGISALIINSSNEILLVNLTSFDYQYYTIPGGGIDENETAQQALFREIYEELGIAANNLELLAEATQPVRFKFKSGPRVRNGVTYIGQERQFFALKFIGENSDIHLNPDEVRKYVWSSYIDLAGYLLFDQQLEQTVKIIHEICPHITMI